MMFQRDGKWLTLEQVQAYNKKKGIVEKAPVKELSEKEQLQTKYNKKKIEYHPMTGEKKLKLLLDAK